MVLNKKVLVLNKSWMAMHVITVRRAVILLFKDDALVVDPTQEFQTFTWDDWSKLRPENGEDCIAATNTTFRVPEVIVLRDFNKLPARRTNFSRIAVCKRDEYTCKYCGAQPGTSELTLEHILPRSRGGKTTWENVCLACAKCNRRKGNRTMEEANMTFFHEDYKPKKPYFSLFKTDVRIESWSHFLNLELTCIPTSN